MHTPLLSVVICTYNNADSLQLTLKQLLGQSVAVPESIEIVVINNNSSDHTELVCQTELTDSAFYTLYSLELKQGLSHARNAGLDLARGRYVLFTDDDADLPCDWMANYLSVIEKHQPDCLFSSIRVIWDQPQPWWYFSVYRACFVEIDYGGALIDINDIHHEFFGKNFCVKKSVLVALGGFDPALGRMGDKLIAGEETVLYRRLVSDGCKVVYFPGAEVGHRLKPKEYTEEHIRKLFLDGAYSSLRIARVFSRRTIAGRPVGLLVSALKELVLAFFACLLANIFSHRQKIFYHRLRVSKARRVLYLWLCNFI